MTDNDKPRLHLESQPTACVHCWKSLDAPVVTLSRPLMISSLAIHWSRSTALVGNLQGDSTSTYSYPKNKKHVEQLDMMRCAVPVYFLQASAMRPPRATHIRFSKNSWATSKLTRQTAKKSRSGLLSFGSTVRSLTVWPFLHTLLVQQWSWSVWFGSYIICPVSFCEQ